MRYPDQEDASLVAELQAFADAQYRGINHNRLMTVTLTRLTEQKVRCTFENIVVAAFKLFPQVFCLEGYSQYPDAARVNRTLLHCKPKYEDYIGTSGTGARGLYYLTPRGMAAAEETAEMLRGATAVSKGRAKTPRSHHEQIVSDVRRSDAFNVWLNTGQLNETDAYTSLHLLPGASVTAIRENLQIIEESSARIDDADVAKFLQAVRSHFSGRI